MTYTTNKPTLAERYGTSEHGNFYVKDTIGVPHTYCIGSDHMKEASTNFGGMLSREAIESAERKGAKCCTCRGTLSYAAHEIALLVACKKELKDEEGKVDPELHAYLLRCKPACEEDKYAGFAFLKETP